MTKKLAARNDTEGYYSVLQTHYEVSSIYLNQSIAEVPLAKHRDEKIAKETI
jgi:hypothetical protein